MSADTTGVSFPPWLLQEINDNHMRIGYRYRSEFLQEAAIEKLQREGVDVEVPEQ
jgi:metal-responsive CopG/Arc/MetJ family transcriptional regulator